MLAKACLFVRYLLSRVWRRVVSCIVVSVIFKELSRTVGFILSLVLSRH